MSYRKVVSAVLFFALSLALIGCAGSPVMAANLGTVTMGFGAAQPSQTHTPFYVAREMGYWDEDGLEVNFEWTSGSSQGIQLLAAGQLDFTAANHDTLIFAVHQGAQLKAVFQEHTKCEFVFAVPKDSPIKTLEDIKGKKLGVSALSSGFVPYAKAAFFEAGLDQEKDLNFIEVGSGATAATAITSGQVDVLGLWEVALVNLENTLGYDYFRYIKPPLYDRLACNAVFTNNKLIEEKPELIAAFLRGVAKGTLFMQTNPEAAIQIFFKHVPEAKPQGKDDATIMKEALHTAESENVQRSNMNRPQANPNKLWGFLVESEFTAAQDVNVLMGILTEKLPVDRFMTNQFSEAINSFDSEAVKKQALEFKVK